MGFDDYPEVERRAQAVLRRHPNEPHSLAYLGYAQVYQGQVTKGMSNLYRAAELAPDRGAVLTLLGKALLWLARFDECVAVLNRAEAAGENVSAARMTRASARLALGDYPGGWADLEERLRFPPQGRPERLNSAPQWDGRWLGPDKTILVWCDNAFGDAIQFSRFLPQVRQQSGARLVMEGFPTLERLFRQNGMIDDFLPHSEDAFPVPYDAHLPMMSVPGALGVRLENLSNAPYLRANEEDITQWMSPVPEDGYLRVGVVWKSSVDYPGLYVRSTCLSMWDSVLKVPGVRFYSLQHDIKPTDKRVQLTKRPFTDFADTAAFVKTLDLVISVDTAVAHLAGAMGKKTWVLLPHNADWRWENPQYPWYETARPFQQDGPDDWAETLNRVATALRLQVMGAHKHKEVLQPCMTT